MGNRKPYAPPTRDQLLASATRMRQERAALKQAIRQMAVTAEVVLLQRVDVLTGGEVDADLRELLLALVALPADVRGPTAPELLDIAQEVGRA